MFTPLTPSQMVAAIGLAARAAARTDDGLDEFDRGQLMSAYSASRHLSIEIASFGAELSSCCRSIADAAQRSGDDELRGFVSRLREAHDPQAAGDAIAELLEACRAQPELSSLRDEVHGALRALCDAEVALLADGIEAGRG
jgi:hypothetical protein